MVFYFKKYYLSAVKKYNYQFYIKKSGFLKFYERKFI